MLQTKQYEFKRKADLAVVVHHDLKLLLLDVGTVHTVLTVGELHNLSQRVANRTWTIQKTYTHKQAQMKGK